MVLKATANNMRHLAFCHDEFRGPRPGLCRSDLQLTPNHILECPTVATKLLKMGMVPLRDSLRELLYSPDAPRIAEAVIKTFDGS
ncbi:hypothetical protein TNCV_2248091 [Trichonephila clavipes]|nr:hypothetical protein TNCV_2248091 [Trichonephila clavipes]